MSDPLRDQLRQAYDNGAEARDRRVLPQWKLNERAGFLIHLRANGLTRLLEVGAGTGRDGRFFADAGCEVTCIDLSPAMVQLCVDKKLPALVMDVVDLIFDDESFDAVYAFNSLLHFPKNELPAVLMEIRRVLAPGGLFYFGTYGGFDHEGIYKEDDHNPQRFFSFYSDEHLRYAVSKTFDIQEFQSIDVNESDPRFRFQSILLRKPGTSNLNPKGKGQRMQLVDLVSTSNLADIALIKSLLDSEGIPYLAQGEHFHSVRPLIEPVRFLVAEEDLDRARPLIESIRLSFVSFANLGDREGLQSEKH